MLHKVLVHHKRESISLILLCFACNILLIDNMYHSTSVISFLTTTWISMINNDEKSKVSSFQFIIESPKHYKFW